MTSISVQEFCQRHDISKAFFYKLQASGLAPKTFKIGRLTRISDQAEQEWMSERVTSGAAA
jgi:predicted DNA-binding transcriptional regulator AlpA